MTVSSQVIRHSEAEITVRLLADLDLKNLYKFMPSQTFSYAKGKSWQRWLFASCVLAFAALATVRSLSSTTPTLGLWLPVFLLVLLGAFAFRGVFDHRPALTIGPEGIWFAHWKRERPIPWSEIKKLKLQSGYKGGSVVCVYLKDEGDMQAISLSKNFFGTALLDISAADACAIASKYLEKTTPN